MSVIALALAAAVTVAFPRSGQVLPAVTRTYAIGAVPTDVTNVLVNGISLRPYRTGAWATLVPVVDGSNRLTVVAHSPTGVLSNAVDFSVTPRVKRYTKLAYAKDRPTQRTASGPGEVLVYLDPGHGGPDTGAVSPHGRFEKDANLVLAQVTAERLRERGYRVELTRTDDTALELYARARAAHDEDATLFVSIHHNAPAVDADPTARYSGVYSWNELGDPLARAIAARFEKTHEGVFPSKGVLRANFAVTRSPQIPSCLVEADFITSPMGEEDIFSSEVGAARAQAIADGIDDWCRTRFVR